MNKKSINHPCLFLLLSFMFYCTCFLHGGESTPVNYYIQTLEGLNNNFDIVDANSTYMLAPTGLCVGLNGDLFVSDAERHLVFRIFNMWKSVEVYAGYVTNGYNGDGLKAVGTLLNGPSALSVNPVNGDLFIADSANNLIRIVSNSTRTTSSISHTFNNPMGVYVSSNGFAYISDTNNNLIKKYDISTQEISIIGGGGYLDGTDSGVDATKLKLQSPKNIFVVSSGNKDVIYFTDSERLRSIDENGIYRIVDGGTAQSNLYGIFVSNGGEIYTSSQSDNIVQMKLLNSDETKIRIGGTEGYDGDNQLYDSGIIKFYEPSSLIVSQNSIIVADKFNNCIRKIDLQSKIVSTLVGGLVNHPWGENISPLKMDKTSTITFPFYYKNDLYFVESNSLLRKVSNGKVTTLLGRKSQTTPKYTANHPQRTYFDISNILYIGNGDVILNNKGSYYNFNMETQNLTRQYQATFEDTALAVVGDSFENSTIFIMDGGSIFTLQKSKYVQTLIFNTNSYAVINQLEVIPNLRYPNSNSLFLFSTSLNILYEFVDFKNTSISIFNIPVPAPSTYFLSGFSVNTNTSLFFWSDSQVYDFQLETYSWKKISGLDYVNVSNSIVQFKGFNGDNIPMESSALLSPTVFKYGSRILITNTNYLTEVYDGKTITIAGITPLSQTLAPFILMRDPLKKVIYYLDSKTVKRFDESTGKSTSLTLSIQQVPNAITVKTSSYLTLNLNAGTKNFGIFSKFDRKLYIKDTCRIIRMDPETSNFNTIIGTSVCGLFKTGVKGSESPCPNTSNFFGMTTDANGDFLLAGDVTIYRYNILTEFISTEFTFTKVGNISSDGIISNQTNLGDLSNIHYQDGFLYLITNTNIRRIEKLSDNTYYLRTLVGNSVTGYSGDKLPALKSSLYNPSAIYVKKNGDIIILDGTGTFSVRMYQKQSGLLVDIAGSRAIKAQFNGDGFGTYSSFTSFSKQVDYDEDTGEIFLIDANLYIRKIIPSCGSNYTYNSWNNTCDLKLSCNGTLATSANACNGNGICSDFDNCQCKEGFEGKFCEIQNIATDSTGVLIVAIVVPVVGSLLILLVVLVLVIVIVLCFKKKKKKTDFEIAKLDNNNVQLSETTFLSMSSMIISSSAGSSVGSDVSDPLSRYSNIVRIGSGAFGSVYKVTDVKSNKLKAIKTVKFESLTDLNTVMKEASQLSFIKHPNIIKINDYFITDDHLLIIDMDYYEMGDLTKLKPENCTEKITKQILKQMLNALKYVHEEMHIIHRDIKPTNIFIKKISSDNIEIVLADFGLAKKYQEMTGQSYAGTPLYMSPEVALGSTYSYNTDIFSLGVSLYQIMTGDLSISISNLLMRSQTENANQTLANQMKESHCEYSDELIQIVLKMLEKDSNQRPSAAQLLSLDYFK